ncbi:hypothetical protein B0T22DRAFT_468314 [Podospora appendiculata]|uniref:Genetic interactor of prohibitins 3, mitochondrial n=1 Tax=Podospora appendiculata TaxID=314037 RepID=A0AAE1C911_9PEZI|nr:hypothetical protein B0T22DRAFT_468314 [Podospora appendiculata]
MRTQAGRTLSSRWLGRVFGLDRSTVASAPPPLYLCPALRPGSLATVNRRHGRPTQIQPRRTLHLQAAASTENTEPPRIDTTKNITRHAAGTLPTQCHGCGAFSQTTVPNMPGHFDLSRKAVRLHLGLVEEEESRPRKHDEIVQQALSGVDLDQMARLGINLKSLVTESRPSRPEPAPIADAVRDPPLCDRCHDLVHHHTGHSIAHPGLDSLRDTIEESPYKYNHIYHVLDAADFPMSLLPKIHEFLDFMPLRSQNRRAMTGKFYHGRRMEMSFIITRSDLLARKKEEVDSLMPYLRETLRDALGRAGKEIRLGNVRCVSAKRGWWTKELKKEIFERGGAGWMVGKVNVGKSRLFEAVFPQGKMLPSPPTHPKLPLPSNESPETHSQARSAVEIALKAGNPLNQPPPSKHMPADDQFSLLPPAQPETMYPKMPIVSSLPGTTASPIRVPFGNGKGELIDLPGLSRGDLELHIKPEHRASLVMPHRITPEQQVLHPGRSLLLGGFIRITPRTPDLVFLAYAFTPITPHVSATEKAIAIQEQASGAPNVENIALPATGPKIKLAGTFPLRFDVTEHKAGPITRKNALNVKVERLPYRVCAIDILIEGCGWVEIVAQMRAKTLYPLPREPMRTKQSTTTTPPPTLQARNPNHNQDPSRLDFLDLSDPDDKPAAPRTQPRGLFDAFRDEPAKGALQDENSGGEPQWPVVDVYSPEGRFIASRRPMNAWELNKPREVKSRPRRSMRGHKKAMKARMRGE